MRSTRKVQWALLEVTLYSRGIEADERVSAAGECTSAGPSRGVFRALRCHGNFHASARTAARNANLGCGEPLAGKSWVVGAWRRLARG